MYALYKNVCRKAIKEEAKWGHWYKLEHNAQMDL
jgi:hypothetical protein